MLVSDWMTKEVITVSPSDSLLTCRNISREHGIRRLPVLDREKKIVGIISTTDLKAFSPKLATGLEILETLDMLADTKVRDVMIRNPVTVTPDDIIEEAALKILHQHVSCLPVVDAGRHVVGILTGVNIFRALLSISGAIQGGDEICLVIPNAPGTLKAVTAALREFPVSIISVLSTVAGDGMRTVKVRYSTNTKDDWATVDAVNARFATYPGIQYWTKNRVVTRSAGA